MMGEKEPSASLQRMNDGNYATYFGVSCAFVALHLMSRRRRRLDMEHAQRCRLEELMLRGSAQLLGLLVERVGRREEALEEKLRKAELEVDELKQRRTEDAKANEKVASIFAAHEQRWIAGRKSLVREIRCLVAELRILKARNEEVVLDSRRRAEEDESAMRVKDEALEEEAGKRRELEEKLRLAEEAMEELEERTKKEAQERSAELWKHKTAFVELVSNQRQLEAEMARALRQAEAAKQELDEVFERKEEAVAMVEKLSGEIVKLQKDAEQKDKILSAMLRKSKLDTAAKQMLLKEVKISKAKKKQAELEMERWKNMWESRHKKGSRAASSWEAGCSQNRRAEFQLENRGYGSRTLLSEYLEAESRKEHESSSAKGESFITTIECLDRDSSDGSDDHPVSDDFERLQDWVRLETEKYATILEQRHYAVIEAFTEQLRIKDEKLEALRWQLLSMELESKRLQSHIEGLDGNLSHFKEENFKLEALLLDKEKELKLLKEEIRYHVQHCQKNDSNSSPRFDHLKRSSSSSESCDSQALWSEVKITKRKPREKEQESKTSIVRGTQKVVAREMDGRNANEETELMHLESHKNREFMCKESTATGARTISPTNVAPPADKNFEENAIVCVSETPSEEPKRAENTSRDEVQSIILTSQSPKEESEEEKEVSMDPGNVHLMNSFQEGADIDGKLSSVGPSIVKKDSSWRMDVHALGVSYKIKRLKQQLLVIEKLAESQAMNQLTTKDDASNDRADENRQQDKGVMMMISSLNKQVKRYQSLEEKTDDLCQRMHENYRSGSSRNSQLGRTKEQTEALKHFLEETFQLQRYMVATGQKLMEMQSRIASSFAGNCELGESVGFNKRLFADNVRTLLREIQRGVEVRIARVIGDLEGTLASDGILHR
ncbi:trichohyalin isoform X1 [Phoenix dactylifera]|uniref:Trichohyalin isoform X1 n=1 Tax=Phoenix dactylifera TaxID=42345 RepID=A0A8B7CTU0_PHODC|nr:trichohyalin isoform X1 [Phoenix dactylifera]